MEENSVQPNEKKQMSPMMMIAAIVAIVAVAFIGYKAMNTKNTDSMEESKEVGTMQQPTAVVSQPNATDSATSTSDTKIIAVEAGSYYYKPNIIRVQKGQKVKIVMTSKDMMHNFNIDELGVSLPLTKSGETNSVEFTANKVGTFEYYCSVAQHRKLGQVGKLIVE